MSNKKKPVKSKLFNLKEWQTIPNTAKYLSIMFGEDVTDADVLRFGLDRHLKLSVHFVNHAHAKSGDKFLSIREWEERFRKRASWKSARTLACDEGVIAISFSGTDLAFYLKDEELNSDKRQWSFGHNDELKSAFLKKLSSKEQADLLSDLIEQVVSFKQDQSEKFEGRVPPGTESFRGKVSTIKGVWDLPMLGAERLDIEHKYQMLTKGPEITLTGLDGAFVEGKDGQLFQLQEQFDQEWIDYQNSEESKQKSLDFYRKSLNKKIANNEIDGKEADRLLDQRRKNLNKPMDYNDKFFPAGGLPEDSVLVVRTQALIDFQERLSEEDFNRSNVFDGRAETTYLNIIGSMLETFVHKNHGEVGFPSETKLREFLSEKYAGFRGLTERTLAEKFAAAKKAIREEFE